MLRRARSSDATGSKESPRPLAQRIKLTNSEEHGLSPGLCRGIPTRDARFDTFSPGSDTPIVTNTLWALVLRPAVIAMLQWVATSKEEAYLERKFGSAYSDYKRTVRRWL